MACYLLWFFAIFWSIPLSSIHTTNLATRTNSPKIGAHLAWPIKLINRATSFFPFSLELVGILLSINLCNNHLIYLRLLQNAQNTPISLVYCSIFLYICISVCSTIQRNNFFFLSFVSWLIKTDHLISPSPRLVFTFFIVCDVRDDT